VGVGALVAGASRGGGCAVRGERVGRGVIGRVSFIVSSRRLVSDAEPQTQLSTTPTTYQDLSQSTFIDPAELRAAIAASSSRA